LNPAATLTYTHGSDNLVEGTVFFGNGQDHTVAYVFVINGNQTIRQQKLFIRPDGTRFGGGLVVMNWCQTLKLIAITS